jgi:hypothetical protein
MLMYAASTFVMNHRTFFAGFYRGGPPAFVKERELTYPGAVAADLDPRTAARQILVAMNLDGAYSATRRPDGTLVINRQDLLSPRRLTFSPASRTLVVERMEHRTNALLERFHRRRGYATGYALDTVWAVTVDLVIAAMVFWAASGLWLWWEMKALRRPGVAALAGGAGLFALYLLVL